MHRSATQAAPPSVFPRLGNTGGWSAAGNRLPTAAAGQQDSCVRAQLQSELWSLHHLTCHSGYNTTVPQVAVNLAVAEEELQFEHRDLHHGNVLLKPTTEDSLAFRFRCRRVGCCCGHLLDALRSTALQPAMPACTPWAY